VIDAVKKGEQAMSETEDQESGRRRESAPRTLQQLLRARRESGNAGSTTVLAERPSGADEAVWEAVWRTKQRQAESPRPDAHATPRLVQIDNLQSFILKEVPYGLTAIADVQNEVKYDGPTLPDDVMVPDKDSRPPLYWYFDGAVHKIVRALALTYTYRLKDASGEYTTAPDSIYVGFEAGYNEDGSYDAVGSDRPQIMRDPGLAPAVAIPRTMMESGDDKLNKWLNCELATLNIHNFQSTQTGWVDYAGPARDAVSTRPFTTSLVQLLEVPDEFNRLLFWQVDGTAHRVAKALRVQCFDDYGSLRSILIGFQGSIGTGPG
jgi:hypothetical protein